MNDAEVGKEILNNVVLGAGVGASATGLYHLAKKLRQRFDEQLIKGAPNTKDYHDVAFDVPNLDNLQQKKIAFDAYSLATPLAAGGASAILAAALSDKKNKRRNAAIAGVLGGVGGAALNTKPTHEFIAKNIYSSVSPFLEPFLGSAWYERGSGYQAWRAAANIAAGGAGVLGGKALYDISAGPQLEVEKKKKQYNNVNSSRKEYFDALLQDDKNKPDNGDKEAALDDMLDAAYAAYAEKKSYLDPTKWVGIKQLIALAGAGPAAINALSSMYSHAGVAALAGGGVLGGKYMYDKTMSASNAKNTAKALAAKNRMKDSLPVFIDPQEVAKVKNIAATAGADADQEA